MNRLNKHDVNKLDSNKLKAKMPFELTVDGEVIGIVYDVDNLPQVATASACDVDRVNQALKAKHDVDKLTELPLSKKRQAAGMLAQL